MVWVLESVLVAVASMSMPMSMARCSIIIETRDSWRIKAEE